MTFNEDVKRQLTAQGETARAMFRTGESIVDDLKVKIPNHSTSRPDAARAYPGRAPGTLKNSYQVKIVPDDGQFGWKITVGSDDPAATPLELGTLGRGVIRARKAPNLVFFQERTGRWRRTPAVFHPGNRAYHFLSNATRRALGRPEL